MHAQRVSGLLRLVLLLVFVQHPPPQSPGTSPKSQRAIPALSSDLRLRFRFRAYRRASESESASAWLSCRVPTARVHSHYPKSPRWDPRPRRAIYSTMTCTERRCDVPGPASASFESAPFCDCAAASYSSYGSCSVCPFWTVSWTETETDSDSTQRGSQSALSPSRPSPPSR